MRELKRSIARSMMIQAGYTQFNKRRQGWTRYVEGTHKRKVNHEGRSMFARNWRTAVAAASRAGMPSKNGRKVAGRGNGKPTMTNRLLKGE